MQEHNNPCARDYYHQQLYSHEQLLVATRSLHKLTNLPRKVISLSPRLSLSVDANRVFCPTGTRKRATLTDFLHFLVDLGLETLRAGEFAFGICGFEDGAVVDEDLEQAVG